MDIILKIAFAIFGLILFVVLCSIFIAVPVLFLWNWLMPDIFGLKEITIFQAWGLALISALLFQSNRSSSSS